MEDNSNKKMVVLFGKEKIPAEFRFINTTNDYFLYVDDKEKKEHFGLPLEETTKIIETLLTTVRARLSALTHLNEEIRNNIANAMKDFVEEVRKSKAYYDGHKTTPYNQLELSEKENFAQTLGHTCYLPYFMSFTKGRKILRYELDAKAIGELKLPASSYVPALEYIAKHFVMSDVAKFYEIVTSFLSTMTDPLGRQELLFIQANLDSLIDRNLKALPPYEKFFYYETLVSKLLPFIKWYLEKRPLMGQDLMETLTRINEMDVNNYEKTKKLSSELYDKLKTMREGIKILAGQNGAQVATPENAENFYIFLGLLEILSSPNNISAHNGLQGSEVSSPLHQKASLEYERDQVGYYKKHGKTVIDLAGQIKQTKIAESGFYSQDQASHLLNGSQSTQVIRKSLFSRSQSPYSRELQLRLPAVQAQSEKQLLLLTAADPNQNLEVSDVKITKPAYISYDPETFVGKVFMMTKAYRDSGQTMHLRVADYIDAFAAHYRHEKNGEIFIAYLILTVANFLKEKDSQTFSRLINTFYSQNMKQLDLKDLIATNKTNCCGDACVEDLEKYYNSSTEINTYTFPWVEKFVIPEVKNKPSMFFEQPNNNNTSSNQISIEVVGSDSSKIPTLQELDDAIESPSSSPK